MRIIVAAIVAFGFASVISAAYATTTKDSTDYIWRYRAEVIPSTPAGQSPDDGGVTGTMGD